MKTINYRMHHKLDEVFSVEPNNLGIGFVTRFYHRSTTFLKRMPFIILVPLSFLFSLLLYFILGGILIKLVNLLQYGF